MKRFQKPTYSSPESGAGGGAGSGELDELFSKVASLEEREEALGRVLDTLDHRLAVLQLALREIPGERLHALGVAVLPVEHDHALHLDPVADQNAKVLVAVGLVALGDTAADDDSGAQRHQLQHRFEHFAADVVEVHVGAFRTGLAQIAVEVPGLVVDAGVEAELVHHVVALLLAAGDAHRAAAADLCQLPDHAADRAGGGRHHHGLARLGRADLLHAAVRGQARHAEHAQVVRERYAPGVDLDELLALHAAVELPAGGEYLVALLERRVLRLRHFARGLPNHDFADLHRRRIGLDVVHAESHVRVERQPEVLHQHLAVLGPRRLGLHQLEVGFGHGAAGTAGQGPGLVGRHISSDRAPRSARGDVRRRRTVARSRSGAGSCG